MYRIAIIESNPDEREQAHRLAAAFFAQRQENVAFVICESPDQLPRYYDCYLQGDEQGVSILNAADGKSLFAAVKKPLEQDAFFSMLEKWQTHAPKTSRILKKRGVG
ncbi:MAG: hypothetical protein RRY97_07525 [Oscillibacter sp.]